MTKKTDPMRDIAEQAKAIEATLKTLQQSTWSPATIGALRMMVATLKKSNEPPLVATIFSGPSSPEEVRDWLWHLTEVSTHGLTACLALVADLVARVNKLESRSN